MKTKTKKMKQTALFMSVLFVAAALSFVGCYPTDFGGSDSGMQGEIETQYAAAGPYDTSRTSVSGYSIYYPANMTGDHPIITWGNGTGAMTASYAGLLDHLASWGFVVIASSSTMTGTGDEMVGGIDYLIEADSDPDSEFHGMLNTDKIGATGHSQGGGGAINAATDPRVTCSAPIAPAPGNAAQVEGPMLLIAGGQDAIVSASLVRMTSFSLVRCPTIFAIEQSMGHMDFAFNGGNARGYLTAWFMYLLQNDAAAAQAFIGECEICSNANWEVEKKNFEAMGSPEEGTTVPDGNEEDSDSDSTVTPDTGIGGCDGYSPDYGSGYGDAIDVGDGIGGCSGYSSDFSGFGGLGSDE